LAPPCFQCFTLLLLVPLAATLRFQVSYEVYLCETSSPPPTSSKDQRCFTSWFQEEDCCMPNSISFRFFLWIKISPDQVLFSSPSLPTRQFSAPFDFFFMLPLPCPKLFPLRNGLASLTRSPLQPTAFSCFHPLFTASNLFFAVSFPFLSIWPPLIFCHCDPLP